MWTALLLAVCRCHTLAALTTDTDDFLQLPKPEGDVDLKQFLNEGYIRTTVVATRIRGNYNMDPKYFCRDDKIECVSSKNFISTSNFTFNLNRETEKWYGVFLRSTKKTTSALLINPAIKDEYLVEKLLYSNHNNSCGVFYVVHFLSSSLWKRINEIAEFSDLNTLDQSTTYLAEAWQNINKTLYQPQNDEDYTAKDEGETAVTRFFSPLVADFGTH
ncbi:uncharacterized protein LOC144142278 [Haemaphysalis longicornis]